MEKYWIIKYALTKGIYEVKAKTSNDNKDVLIAREGISISWFHGEGKEWCKSQEDAISRANDMKIKKIESLKKQLKSLENMTFEHRSLDSKCK